MSEHFSVTELTFSSTAQRFGINNTPDPTILEAMTNILIPGLERVRSILWTPMHIDSGYRCLTLNQAIGGAEHSAHMDGLAADFIAPVYGSPQLIVAVLITNKEAVGFHRLIQEGTWVHIDFPPAGQPPAYLVLTAHFGPAGTTYSQGARA